MSDSIVATSSSPVEEKEVKTPDLVSQIIPGCVNLLLNNDDQLIRQNISQVTNTGLFYLAGAVLDHVESGLNITGTDKAVIVEQTLKQVIHSAGLDDPIRIQELEDYVTDHVIEGCKALGRFSDTLIKESAECISDKIVRFIKCSYNCIKSRFCCCLRSKQQ